jgi:MFS superfamily sulfate permease-like transporter
LLKGNAGFHATDFDPAVRTVPGLVLWRFNSALVFFNAHYFKREAVKAMNTAGPDLKWFVLDILPVARLDLTGLDAVQEVRDELHRRGAQLVIAGRGGEIVRELDRLGLPQNLLGDRYFPTLRQALRAYRTEVTIGGAVDDPRLP